MRVLITAVVLLAVLPAGASEPGQPLDCSDMVFHEPGLTCVPFVPIGEIPGGDPTDDDLWRRGSDLVVDNLGRFMFIKLVSNGSIQVLRREGPVVVPIASVTIRASPYGSDGIHPRCNGFSCGSGGYLPVQDGITFDPIGGRLIIPLMSRSNVASGSLEDYPWIAAIEGFATTFEIMQTYTPTSGPISFRVPYMPEGLPAADSFDTYYGDLATVGDWSQAQGLQCDYPTEIPSAGDYLTVADTLPTPGPGDGYYYVTAASYQGDTRYGRKRVGGVTSGRDPAVLPQCGK